jgi:hypothetical protein
MKRKKKSQRDKSPQKRRKIVQPKSKVEGWSRLKNKVLTTKIQVWLKEPAEANQELSKSKVNQSRSLKLRKVSPRHQPKARKVSPKTKRWKMKAKKLR